MLAPMPDLELSIIVPVLNERATIPALLAMLALQADVSFEVLLVDGGSTDGTPELIRQQQPLARFPLRLLSSSSGRARQLNAGAEQAAAAVLLFLHADSNFPDSTALQRSLQCYLAEQAERPGIPIGGHFQLRFQLSRDAYGFGYYFWEWKAALDRPDCTHGDQGLLLTRQVFSQIGPFDETAPIAAESLWAEQLRKSGHWLLLPAVLQTSARRFEVEGLAARQTLNALLMNCAAVGWQEFFTRSTDVYRCQNHSAPLVLSPYLDLIQQLLDAMPPQARREFWLATGRFVRNHAWQIPFALDARRAYRKGISAGKGATAWLNCHDRWFDLLTDNRLGVLAAAGLTWSWFWQLKRRAARSEI
jgi:rSAM/selenodomain-associated transferase 2